jgi:hypothetical protein
LIDQYTFERSLADSLFINNLRGALGYGKAKGKGKNKGKGFQVGGGWNQSGKWDAWRGKNWWADQKDKPDGKEGKPAEKESKEPAK